MIKAKSLPFLFTLLAVLLILLAACSPQAAGEQGKSDEVASSGEEPPAADSTLAVFFGSGECQVKAVDLLAAWVEAGAPEGDFAFSAEDGASCTGDFDSDVLPLFVKDGVWFSGSLACSGCHFAGAENSYHEMDLTSHAGILAGADVLEEPPGVSILGESEAGQGDYDWSASKLRQRLRNNRMPPGWDFDISEANRDGPCVQVSDAGVKVDLSAYGCDLNAVGLIAAWVESGAPDGGFEYGEAELTFERDVLPFFTKDDMWFEGSQACSACHFALSEHSYHEMDLRAYEGILAGADSLEDPPGVSILGESEPGKGDFDWGKSKLRERLRNNRMAPGVEFDITEANRDGPVILAGKKQ